VHLQPAGARLHLLGQRLGPGAAALAEQSDVHRHAVEGLQHPRENPRTGGAGGALAAVGGPGAAADHRGDAIGQGLLHLLGGDEIDVAVDPAGGGEEMLTGDDVGSRADDQPRVDTVLGVRIPGLADRDDAPVLDPDVALDHSDDGVEHDDVGDHQVQRTLG